MSLHSVIDGVVLLLKKSKQTQKILKIFSNFFRKNTKKREQDVTWNYDWPGLIFKKEFTKEMRNERWKETDTWNKKEIGFIL